jgi:hypothetical protein
MLQTLGNPFQTECGLRPKLLRDSDLLLSIVNKLLNTLITFDLKDPSPGRASLRESAGGAGTKSVMANHRSLAGASAAANFFRGIGSNTRQTLAARMRWPAALG